MKLLFPKLKSIHQVFSGILLLWLVTFFFHERFLPFYQATQCQWSQMSAAAPKSHDFKSDQDLDSHGDSTVTNVLFIADPQLIDNHTYPGRNPLLLKLSQHTADIYIKKNYRSLVNHLNPDYVFFLGDYLDNGRSCDNSYYKKQYNRFKNIFPHKKYGFKKDHNFFINLPGNHDIGIGDGVKLESRKRFSKKFGKVNLIVSINNVEIISLDTPSLMSTNEEINQASKAFLEKNFGPTIYKTTPRILLTHVPLYRDPKEKTCGPLRESSQFQLLKGYQYQSVVDSHITANILDYVKPDLVFSGDDHDYCDIKHNEISREITVKSISMAMGIWKPGVQILSFMNQNDNLTYDTKLCYLPTPYYNIIHYVFTAVISGLVLLYWNYNQSKRGSYSTLPVANTKKINDFLQEQDSENKESVFTNLPTYTNTSVESSSPFKQWVECSRTKISRLKKINVLLFLKQALVLGTLTIMLYSLFCATI